MAKYPTNPIPSYEHVTQQRWKTVISIFDDGNEQRRQKWTAPQYDVTLQYNAVPTSYMSTLWSFFESRKGAYEAFHYYIGEAWSQKYTVSGAYIAVADGAATVFRTLIEARLRHILDQPALSADVKDIATRALA